MLRPADRSREETSTGAAAAIRSGTAGWSYEDWNGIVYPVRPPRGFDRLRLMASLFDTNEINSTFYRIPPPRMAQDWASRVGDNPRFRFTAKLYRGFTHERDSGFADERALRDALTPLSQAQRLGALLAQFPMSFRDTPANRRHLERLCDRFADLPLAAEFRHASWDSEEIVSLLEQRRVAFVNIDQPSLSGNLGATGHVTAPIAYFRFHGRNAAKWFGPDTSNEERYDYLYAEAEMSPWIGRIAAAAERVRGIDASSATARGVYVVLNNHFRGQAVANALEIQARIQGEFREAPETLRAAYPSLGRITRQGAAGPQHSLFS